MILTLSQLHPYAIGGLVVGFVVICVLLILTVLIQRSQGGGLAGAFGSAAGSGQTAFGAKTGDALTIFTISMFTIYVLAAIGLNYVVRPAEAEPTQPTIQEPAPQTPMSGTTTPTPGAAAPAATPTAAPVLTPAATPAAVPTLPASTEPAATPAPAPKEEAPKQPAPAETPKPQ